MAKDEQKRLSIAQKRALSRPLQLGEEHRVPDEPPEHAGLDDWTDAVLQDQARKKLISLRVDADVLEFFKEHGSGYQTRINAVLRAYMQMKKELKQA